MRNHRPLILASAIAAAAVPLLAAGCGGGAPHVARIGSTSTRTVTTTGNPLIAYVHCIRVHGVPAFPDPDSTGGIPKDKVIALQNDPKLARATSACQSLMPATGLAPPPASAQQTRTRIADELSFAHCMRREGVTNFPDPSASGGLTVAMIQAHGIDLRSPVVLRVALKCLPASHGALNVAKISAAIKDARG
jgi:hypothetical protein